MLRFADAKWHKKTWSHFSPRIHGSHFYLKEWLSASRDSHRKKGICDIIWLVVSTYLKKISQIGNLPQLGLRGANKTYLKPPPSYCFKHIASIHFSNMIIELLNYNILPVCSMYSMDSLKITYFWLKFMVNADIPYKKQSSSTYINLLRIVFLEGIHIFSMRIFWQKHTDHLLPGSPSPDPSQFD